MNHLKKEKLTQKRLKKLLHYNPETGIFTWKVTLNSRAIKGYICSCSDANGYIKITIEGRIYLAHRLAWLYVYGYFPENDIDHKDRIQYHNWISNLREVSKSCNARNCGNRSDNTSGVKGVGWSKRRQKWAVQIWINNIKKFIGYYKDFDEAVCHRLFAEQCLEWEGCDSSSPAYQYVQKMLQRKIKCH